MLFGRAASVILPGGKRYLAGLNGYLAGRQELFGQAVTFIQPGGKIYLGGNSSLHLPTFSREAKTWRRVRRNVSLSPVNSPFQHSLRALSPVQNLSYENNELDLHGIKLKWERILHEDSFRQNQETISWQNSNRKWPTDRNLACTLPCTIKEQKEVQVWFKYVKYLYSLISYFRLCTKCFSDINYKLFKIPLYCICKLFSSIWVAHFLKPQSYYLTIKAMFHVKKKFLNFLNLLHWMISDLQYRWGKNIVIQKMNRLILTVSKIVKTFTDELALFQSENKSCSELGNRLFHRCEFKIFLEF